MQRPFISLTTKIVLLVTLMGLAFGLINVYTIKYVQLPGDQYHALLEKQLDTAAKVDVLRQHLEAVAVAMHTAGEATAAGGTFEAQETLTQLQQVMQADLTALQQTVPLPMETVVAVAAHGQQMFEAAQRFVQAKQQAQDEYALQILLESWAAALDQVAQGIGLLRHQSESNFDKAAHTLQLQAQQNVHTGIVLGWCGPALILALAAWLAWYFVSRPIERLTKRMRSVHLDTDDSSMDAYQNRRDEIGGMAHALQQLRNALQKAQKLEHALVAHQKNQGATEFLQQLTTALPGAVFQIEQREREPLKLRFVSPQWAKLLGISDVNATDTATAASVIRHHDRQVTATSEQHFSQSARTLEPVDFEVSINTADGTTRWIKTRANPLKQEDGSVIFNGVWLDVTKEIQQAQALKKAKAQAEQDAQARTILQASISHEIRTPLNAILGLTQLILKADLPEAQREQLNNVLRASQHLRGIVNEVLDFSKIDAGQLKLESTDFSLQNVVLDVVRMCQEEASKKGLSLRYSIAPEVPDKLRGDPHRIAQILLNYVNNAIKFTSSGQVQITLQLAPSSTLHRVALRASVTDTGPGIPADRIPVLFEAFQQADNSITRRFGGTGLGLAISRALAQLMGGNAGVDSRLGKGSTFWFTAVLEPARTVVSDHLPDTPSLPAEPVWKGMRILVVDDNVLNRAVAEGMLHAMGLETDTAEDGVQALLKLQSVGPEHYRCVLMDIQMPQMDGISATKALRQLAGFEHLPIIAMTAHSGLEDVERTQAAGMNAHLSKPLLESALHAALQQWLSEGANLSLYQGGQEREVPLAEVPPLFDTSAIDALVQLFPPEKLQRLLSQFIHDSLQRTQILPDLVQQQDWQTMRAEAHKLAGTAATFGLLQLGYWSQSLSAALKQENALEIQETVKKLIDSAEEGIAQLQAYTKTSA